MKRLLIIPIILALIVFSFYYEDVDDMHTAKKVKVSQNTLREEEIIEIYNSKVELNSSYELNESIDDKFSVEIIGTLNTMKKTIVTLKAKVKNAQEVEKCNYFWYKDKHLLSVGQTLEESFEQGEYTITVVVKDVDGNETNNSVILRAYNYESITKLHYDAYYGNLLYTERMIRNHNGQYVLYDNGIYSKEIMRYEDELLRERTVEYVDTPEEYRRVVFSYDEKGNRVFSQTFNREGVSVNYVVNIYDENSSLIDIKFGTSPDDIEEDDTSYEELNSEDEIYETIVYEELESPKDIVKKNDNGQIVYEEYVYGDTKETNRMTYNEENKLIKSVRTVSSSYDTSHTILEYDDEGNPIKTEKKYELKGHSSCHYSSANTYTDRGLLKSRVSTLLGGSCPYIDEIERRYTYDDEDNLIKVKVITENEEASEAHSTLEVLKEYLNEIDIY